MIDIKKFDSNLLKVDKRSHKNIGIYNIRYITIKKIDYYENIYSVNPLYLIITHASGYIEEKSVNKYLVIDSMELHSTELHSKDENKELIKNIMMFFMELETKSKKNKW